MPTRLLSVNRSLLHFSPSSQSFLSHSPVIASSLFFSADHIVYQHALDRIVSHPPLPTCSPIFGYCLFSWLLVLLCRVVSRSFHFLPVDRLFVLPSLPLSLSSSSSLPSFSLFRSTHHKHVGLVCHIPVPLKLIISIYNVKVAFFFCFLA